MPRILKTVFIAAPVEMYHFWLSYFALGWAIILWFHTEVYHTAHTYSVFRSFNFDPMVWLLIYGGVSLFGFFSCFSGKKPVLMVSTMLMFILWSFTVCALYFSSFVFNTGTFVYGTFALVSAWTYLRVGNFSFSDTWSS